MSILLYEHNRAAYDAVVDVFSKCKKAAVIHPTGTGKSFIGFKLCENNPDKTVCWLSPSDYIFKTQLENLKKAANGYTPENIRFFTYAKLMNMSDEELGNIKPDYIILDEFHRCGAEMWGKGVQKLLSVYPCVFILGLSATAIRYLDNQRDMADELFDGNVASEITLGEAVVKGILNPPKYILSMFSYQKDLEKYKRRIRHTKNKAVQDEAGRYFEALRRKLEKAEGLDEIFKKHMKEKDGKYIVFCANMEHMQEMIEKAPEWFGKVDESPHIYSAYSDDPETSKAFAEFKNDSSKHLKLLFCINMLNEGIHVEDVKGVILFRPTVSPIIYKQQIGRALSASGEKEPVIFDIVNNIENLYSIRALEEEMQLAINYYRFRSGEEKIVNDSFKIIDEVRDCRELFDKLNDTLSASWNVMYEVAKRYYEENGNLTPSNRYKTKEGYSLGSWIVAQRNIRKGKVSGFLTDSQIKKLDEIGMRWENLTDYRWNKNYNALLEYKEKHGDIDVPGNYVTKDKIELGRFVVLLRMYQASGIREDLLTPERKKLLDDLGMIWNKIDYIWECNYQAAVEYYMEHGNLNVPKNYHTSEGIALGAWIYNIRYNYRTGNGKALNEGQKERLEAIGMEFLKLTPADFKWEENYKKAEKYYKEHGNLDVPYYYKTEDGFALGLWINRHRTGKKKKAYIEVSENRRKRLDEIGMIWEKEGYSEEKIFYTAVQNYYEENGNLDISSKVKYNGVPLGNWLMRQRGLYKKGKLLKERIDWLNKYGMQWESSSDRLWEEMYKAARSFYDENKHLKVPEEYKKLNSWIINQRKNYRENKISGEKYKRLSDIGMIWDFEDLWEANFKEAKKFYENNHHLDIPAEYVTESGVNLGRWYRKQRSDYKNGKLSQKRKEYLEEIGIEWVSVKERAWMNYYKYAEKYYSEKGNLRVHLKYETQGGVKLGAWISSQRELYMKGKLKQEQIKMLEMIGMEWNRFQSDWDNAFSNAESYYKKHGNVNVNSVFVTDDEFKLGVWINSQRNKYRNNKLTPEQIRKLEGIGIIWSPNDALWFKGYEKAKEYYEKNGNAEMNTAFVTKDGFHLGQWVGTQKKKLLKDSLDDEKVELLSRIGIGLLAAAE